MATEPIRAPSDATPAAAPLRARLAFAIWRIPSAYAAGLLTAAWLAPITAGILTITAQLDPAFSQGVQSVVLGLTGAVVLWAGFGIAALPLALPRHVNPRSWSTIQSRIVAIDARVTAIPLSSSSRSWYGEATRNLEHLKLAQTDTWPALRWATRGGYIDLWNRIHHAEEALIEGGEVDVMQVLDRNQLRLEDAASISPRLSPLLDEVAAWFAGSGSAQHEAAVAASGPSPSLPIASESQAYARLRVVTAAINAFGEKNWTGLVRLRNQSVSALLMSELVAYGLVVLAIASGVRPATLIAAIVYFVAAAAVGLLNHVIKLRSWSSAVEDYGLQEVRLRLLPAVSGLAGVAGVVLVAALTNPAVIGALQSTDSVRPDLTSPTNWDNVFSLSHNPLGLVVAALFGLAPSLLVRRLYELAVKYELAIRSTQEVPQVDPRDDPLRS